MRCVLISTLLSVFLIGCGLPGEKNSFPHSVAQTRINNQKVSIITDVNGSPVHGPAEGRLKIESKGPFQFKKAKIICQLFPWEGGGANPPLRISEHTVNVRKDSILFKENTKTAWYYFEIKPILGIDKKNIPEGKYLLRVILETDKGNNFSDLPYWVGYYFWL